MMEEAEHVKEVLESTKKGLLTADPALLRELSNQTIHCASTIQDPGSITIAVLVYALSKLIERRDHLKIKGWDRFVKRFNLFLDLAVKSVKENNEEKYNSYLMAARKSLSTISVSLNHYIEEVMRKASINKASKIYEHGISLGQTAKILGITQWELSEYTGQLNIPDTHYGRTLDIKARAQMALEFFS
jgi:hypothetical protein